MLTRRAFAATTAGALVSRASTLRNGWIFVSLKGSPAEIGFQHGSQLSAQIVEGKKAIERIAAHDTGKDWNFYREAARQVLWPRVEDEYRAELHGIVEGLNKKGVRWDIWDITALNGWMELAWYYADWYAKQGGATQSLKTPEHCSAFVATGSYTRDRRPVMAHNTWVDYAIGANWNVIFDIQPKNGHAIVMDGYPGLIHSGTDFVINRAGIMMTETTISGFHGFDPKGIPEFVRARKAAQYARSIDDVARILKEESNVAYANNWLIADNNRNHIASLELGLKNVILMESSDGYFAGANFPVSEKLAREETDFDTTDMSLSPNARRERWKQLMEEHKGTIDVELAKKFLADDYDTFDKSHAACERTLCGRIDLSPRGSKPWQLEYGPAGAVQNKVTTAAMAGEMRLLAAMGPQAGPAFRAADHIRNHPEFDYQSGILKDLSAEPWTEFRAAR